MKNILSVATTIALLCISHTAFAANAINVEMKDGKFMPSVIAVPIDQKVELKVKNSETTEVEFESYSLNREVKIKAGETASIFIGPLKAATYPIFDDNNPDAKGSVVAK